MENNRKYEFKPDDFELTQADKKIYDQKFDTKPTTFAKDAVRRFAKNKSSVVAAFLIGALLLLAIFVPVFSPYDISRVHPTERLLLPKLVEPVEGEWSTFWNGTKIIEGVAYDPITKAPADTAYNPNAIVTLEVYDKEYMNKADTNAEGGIFIFAADKTAAKGGTVSYLEIYDEVDFTADGGYTLSFTLADPQTLVANGDFVFDKLKDLAPTEYRVFIEYGELVNGKRQDSTVQELLLKDWSSDYGEVNLDISKAMADAGLTELVDGKIRFQVKCLENKKGYIAIESLTVASTIADEALQERLTHMSMNDANRKLLLNKLNDGTFAPGYWRSNGDKGVYRAYRGNCRFVYDEYEAIYGVKTTKDITMTALQGYIANGWCEYDPAVGPESFKILNADKCPILTVLDQKEMILEISDVPIYELTCEVMGYKMMGYENMPKYLLGSDGSGYDLITISFNGLRTSFILSIIVSAICLSFGLVWGSISGYFGGNVDLFMERFVEILGGVPWIVVMTLAILLLGNNLLTFGMALCLTGWMGTAGTTRTQFYRFKGREYILASRTLGAGDMRLIFKHILPNAMGTIVTGSVLKIPGVIFSEATLSYLNLGLQGSNSFGNILSNNQKFITTAPMLIVFPAIVISVIMISFNLFGNGLRDALNPSLKGSD